MAGNWLLITIDTVVILSLFTLCRKEYSIKHVLTCFVPFILLCVQFSVSCLNPSFKSFTDEDWGQLNISDYFAKEQNLGKAILISEGIESIILTSKKDPELANCLFFDLKNRYFDKYPGSTSSTSKLLYRYEEIITLKSNSIIPTIPIFNHKSIYNFIHILAQAIIGMIFYFLVKSRGSIRQIWKIIVMNASLISVLGICQKINYTPSDDLLEIWGVWDTPEPRYYFASFTYKNHWSAFSLMIISITASLLVNNAQRKGLQSLQSPSNIILILGLVSLSISIPFSGSRSGSILLIFLMAGLAIISIRHFKLYKRNYLVSVGICLIIFLFLCFFSTKIVHKETINEMESNFSTQLNNLQKGKYPLRFLLWKDLLGQVYDKPVFGHGFNSYRSINPLFQSFEVRNERNKVLGGAHTKFIPLISYGHSDWLQKISEFGLVGFLLIFPLVGYIFFVFFSTRSLFVKYQIWGCIIFLIYSLVDFPTQSPICLITFSILVGLSMKYNVISKA